VGGEDPAVEVAAGALRPWLERMGIQGMDRAAAQQAVGALRSAGVLPPGQDYCERCEGDGSYSGLAPCTTAGADCACNGPRVLVDPCPDCGGSGLSGAGQPSLDREEKLEAALRRIAYAPCGVFTKDDAVRHYSKIAREALDG
jgi:hypothetical protein